MCAPPMLGSTGSASTTARIRSTPATNGSGVSPRSAPAWRAGRWAQRVYGDTYGGYAEYATIAVEPGEWSCGPTAVPDDVPVERAVFLEPLADCLHAVIDQAQVRAGDHVVVVAAGSMGLQMVAVAGRIGARVTRRRAAGRNAEIWPVASGPPTRSSREGWPERVRAGADGAPRRSDRLRRRPRTWSHRRSRPAPPGAGSCCSPGFGDRPIAPVDVNAIHYREIALVGSEWIGAPPNQRREHYAEAAEIIGSGSLPLEELVSARCSFDDLEDALLGRSEFRELKTIFVTGLGAAGVQEEEQA